MLVADIMIILSKAILLVTNAGFDIETGTDLYELDFFLRKDANIHHNHARSLLTRLPNAGEHFSFRKFRGERSQIVAMFSDKINIGGRNPHRPVKTSYIKLFQNCVVPESTRGIEIL
ncbi:hypothetical protein TNCV_1317501 [Trichonephila clavipes]|nr:hypothetical protein TNCV_1317501 [Trichonephila clavipes]